ncbi:4'-phosphopantetheinyl transferase superfamily protein [Clostridium sp.]|uniref:4'-phosphopantetheinyl transferase family protein n=1 Tax=Clostridium sp. TaxID=1506 RepID=UPI00359F8B21
MIRKYTFSSFDNLNLEEIVSYVAENYLIIIVIQTIKMDVDSITKRYLQESELKKMNKFVRNIDKINYLITHSIVNFIFSQILECAVSNIRHEKAKNGKPYVENSENVKFNISHSYGGAVVAFYKNDIGVDIEFINRKFLFKDITDISFSEREINYIKNDVKKFYKYWVAKEAYLKYDGVGLFKDIKYLEVIYCNEKNIELLDKQKNNVFMIEIYELFGSYILGICFY